MCFLDYKRILLENNFPFFLQYFINAILDENISSEFETHTSDFCIIIFKSMNILKTFLKINLRRMTNIVMS